MDRQQKARAIECSRCDRRFKDEHALAQHVADYHKIGKRPQTPERYPYNFAGLDGDTYDD